MILTEKENVLTLLSERFGFDELKPGQQEVIAALLAGHSAAAVFPTGGGKSLCYQLPALVFPGLTLVVSPLIALMKDQIDALTMRGISAKRLDSTLNADDYRTVMDEVRSGALRMLYVAPERFNNERFCEMIRKVNISLLAIDEAHCISEWGHNFRPDYLRLANFAKLCNAERVLALTATATEQVLADICRFFKIESPHAIRTGFYRPNLTLLATPVKASKQDELLVALLRQREAGPTIVYVTLQKTAEQLATQICAAGFEARAYHAGMEDESRTKIQDWFIASDHGIVVATIAFGMGIDKSNIRYVYHYNPPKSLENYAQEIGRSGRDGEPAICELLFSNDLNVLENFVYGDTPTAQGVQSFVNEIFSQPVDFDVSLHELSSKHDIRLNVVRTLLTYLDLLGHLQGGTPFYSSFQVKPRMSSEKILSKFEGERREFLAGVFRQMQMKKTWLHIDVNKAGKTLAAPRDRIVRALDYLAEQNYLELRTSGTRQRYKIARVPESLTELSTKLYDRLMQREKREIERLHEVVEWVELDGCQVNALGMRFGESREKNCGHCSWCLRDEQLNHQLIKPQTAIDEAVWQKALVFRRQHKVELGSARSFALFLCGVSSPRLTKSKLSSDPLFGLLAGVPFAEVMERAKE